MALHLQIVSVMYILTTYINGQVYKTKIFQTKPTFHQTNKLINKWSLAYGRHLNSTVTKIGE